MFPGIDLSALKTVIKYIYTHDKSLFTEDNMAKVMQLADFLQCTPIIDLCLDIINENPTVVTLPLYVRYSQPAAKTLEDHESYFTSHYLDIILHPDFIRNIIDVDDLKLFVDPDIPVNMKKEWHLLIFQVLVRWLKFSESREVHALDLLKKVCYEQLTQTDITNEVLPYLTEFSDCGDLIDLLTSYIDEPFAQPFMTERLSTIKDRKCSKDTLSTVLYAFGMQDAKLKSDMMALNLCNKGSIRYWPLYSELGILEPKGDCIGHYTFIVGGYTKKPEDETKFPSASFIRYNMHTGESLNLEDLPQPSFWNSVVIHPRECQLWVLGGVVKKGEEYRLSRAVYIYDIKTNKWKEGPRLPEPLSQLAACHGSDGFDGIFISGGVTQNIDARCVGNRLVQENIYFIRNDQDFWKKIASLEIARYGHAMYFRNRSFLRCSIRKLELYMVGGKSLKGCDVGGIEILCLRSKHTSTSTAPISLGNCSNFFTLGSNMCFFSDKPDTGTIVHYWNNNSQRPLGSILGSPFEKDWDSKKLPFSLKGALVLPCIQEYDSKDPKIVTTHLMPVTIQQEVE